MISTARNAMDATDDVTRSSPDFKDFSALYTFQAETYFHKRCWGTKGLSLVRQPKRVTEELRHPILSGCFGLSGAT
jgi:hypothetical protein